MMHDTFPFPVDLPSGRQRTQVDPTISFLSDMTFAILDAYAIAPAKLHYKYEQFVTVNGDDVIVVINPLDNESLVELLGTQGVQAILNNAAVRTVIIQHDDTRPRLGKE